MRKRKAVEMTDAEFREIGFVLGPKMMSEIVKLVTAHKYTRREIDARAQKMIDAGTAARNRALQEQPEVRVLVRLGRYKEARALVEKGGTE